ncbi:MAG: oxidoreductase [Chloroflexota bacterium]
MSVASGVIGPGRLGTALSAALAATGAPVMVASRRPPAPALLALPGVTGAPVEVLIERCDVVYLAVPDREIAPLAARLSWRPGQAAVHHSGALGLEALAGATDRGALAGCLHPLQTFPAGTPPQEAPALFRGITCGIEAPEPLGARLEALAGALGARSVRLEGVDRAAYHAAAVFASNDAVALMAAAARTWSAAGLSPEAAREALAPLLLAAARNVAALPLERALTGPVARGDVETVERHLAALTTTPDLAALYRALAAELLRLDLGHAPETLAALRRAIEAPR